MDIRYIHFSEAGISCAYTINEDGKSISLGYAVASIYDEFSRSVGRSLAENRLKQKIFPFYIEISLVDLLPCEVFDIMTLDKINKSLSLFDFSGSYLKNRLIGSIISYALFVDNEHFLSHTLDKSLNCEFKFGEANLDVCFVDEFGIYRKNVFCKRKQQLSKIEESFDDPLSIRERLSFAVKSICRRMKAHGEKQERN